MPAAVARAPPACPAAGLMLGQHRPVCYHEGCVASPPPFWVALSGVQQQQPAQALLGASPLHGRSVASERQNLCRIAAAAAAAELA